MIVMGRLSYAAARRVYSIFYDSCSVKYWGLPHRGRCHSLPYAGCAPASLGTSYPHTGGVGVGVLASAPMLFYSPVDGVYSHSVAIVGVRLKKWGLMVVEAKESFSLWG